jgi:hypothetical protein
MRSKAFPSYPLTGRNCRKAFPSYPAAFPSYPAAFPSYPAAFPSYPVSIVISFRSCTATPRCQSSQLKLAWHAAKKTAEPKKLAICGPISVRRGIRCPRQKDAILGRFGSIAGVLAAAGPSSSERHPLLCPACDRSAASVRAADARDLGTQPPPAAGGGEQSTTAAGPWQAEPGATPYRI